MGLKFRKRIKIAPGIYINISNSGVSTSIGGKGATINIGKKGAKATLGVPGTGLSYSTKLTDGKQKKKTKLQKFLTFVLYIVLFLFFYNLIK
ncbi:DUF4236 domain-containing protein [Xenorhabdus bovienii]|uniref:DUF4236 domain-containing protein n=1 Tax=Xenorhabdus bovienii TaxID=40576 RepID=UPI0023B2FB74|nr:DUF4236 domain-containing protein [Xenorhabdus bovienii]MDE9447203.1 DUF4236 domain-containing protein [Xenorhabdus bovienii]